MHSVIKTLAALSLLISAHTWGAWGNVENTDFTFRVAGNLTTITAEVTDLSPAEGDGLVIVLQLNGTGHSPSTPSGYTLQCSDDTGSRAVYIWDKEAGASESDVALTWTGNEESVAWVYLFQGDYNTATIVDQCTRNEAAGLDDGPAITPTDQPSTVITGFASPTDQTPATAPSGMTVVRDFYHSQPNIEYASAYEDYDSTSSTGVMTWNNLTGTTEHWTFNALDAPTGGGSPSISDSSPQPGVTVSYTCGSAFAGNITTMTTVDGDTISAESGADTCDADFIIPVLSAYAVGGSMDDTKWSNSATWTVGDGTTTENITMQIDPPSAGFFGNISCSTCPGDSLVPAGHAVNDDYYCEFTTGSGVVGDSMVAMADAPGNVVSCRTYDESGTAWTNPVSTTFENIASLGGS